MLRALKSHSCAAHPLTTSARLLTWPLLLTFARCLPCLSKTATTASDYTAQNDRSHIECCSLSAVSTHIYPEVKTELCGRKPTSPACFIQPQSEKVSIISDALLSVRVSSNKSSKA